ncbi:hypothetical protein PR048_014057 [Dryococelus australis]|uniref:Uncharacterized protein n=1 Tax=Dryococelus australis TaxID=614101 RepID=A0ABQ9HTY5_9NEOP|nr:hypothetical protein PR048_014057 [Dryococelus australis]
MERAIRKSEFGKILTPACNRAVAPKNVSSVFEATCIYPYNPNRIPNEAYAPSDLTQQTRIEVQSDRALTKQDNIPPFVCSFCQESD